MPNLFIDKSIEISAPAEKVWRIFTDPDVSRAMGGEYVSEWEVGSSIGWKNLDGKMLMSGKILKIEPERLLKHNQFKDVGGIPTLSSVITYELAWQGEKTLLKARESFAEAQDAKPFADAAKGWDETLKKLKDAAEKA